VSRSLIGEGGSSLRQSFRDRFFGGGVKISAGRGRDAFAVAAGSTDGARPSGERDEDASPKKSSPVSGSENASLAGGVPLGLGKGGRTKGVLPSNESGGDSPSSGGLTVIVGIQAGQLRVVSQGTAAREVLALSRESCLKCSLK